MASLDGPDGNCKEYLRLLREAQQKQPDMRDTAREQELVALHRQCMQNYIARRKRAIAEQKLKEEQNREAVAAARSGRPAPQGYQGSKYPAIVNYLQEEAEREAAENMKTPSEDEEESESEGESEGEDEAEAETEDDAMSTSDEDDVFPNNSRRYARQVAIDEAIRKLDFVRSRVEAMTTSADVRANAALAMITHLKNPLNTTGVNVNIIEGILQRVEAYEKAARAHADTMATVEDHATAAEEAVRNGYRQFADWARSTSDVAASANEDLNAIIDEYNGEPYDSAGSDASDAASDAESDA